MPDTTEAGKAGVELDFLGSSRIVSNKKALEETQVSVHKALRKLRSFKKLRVSVAALAVTLGIVFAAISLRSRASTNKPEAYAWRSTASDHLNLPLLYPNITLTPGTDCHEAWHNLSAVPCHNSIVSRDNDEEETRRESVDLAGICDDRCHLSLVQAYYRLVNSCGVPHGVDPSIDVSLFDSTTADLGSDQTVSTPTSAVASLLRQRAHICRAASPNFDSNYDYCAAEMWERFGIANGSTSASLGAIDKFAARPADKAPSCGSCAFGFLNRTLGSWVKDTTLDPKTGSLITLHEFFRRVNAAGRRCAPPNDWVFRVAETGGRYKESGLMGAIELLVLGRLSSAYRSHDLHYLMSNGPSEHDYNPVGAIQKRVAIFKEKYVNYTMPENISRGICRLEHIKKQYLSVPCYINLDGSSSSPLPGCLLIFTSSPLMGTLMRCRSLYCRIYPGWIW